MATNPRSSKRPAPKASARERGMTVDNYAAKAGPAQAEVIAVLRGLIRKAAPKATESIKWGQPVYESNGPMIFMRSSARHVTFGFWRGAELADPRGLLEGDGDKMRHVKITSAAEMDRKALEAFVREAVKLNAEKGDPTKKK